MYDFTFMKYTTDEWYPAFRMGGDKYVEVSLNYDDNEGYRDDCWRVAIWGEDDFGMEKEFENETEASGEILRLFSLHDITVDDLTEQGYVGA